jgi:hypothetical protein
MEEKLVSWSFNWRKGKWDVGGQTKSGNKITGKKLELET